MGAEAEFVCRQSIPVLDVQYRCNLQEIGDIVAITSPISPPSFDPICASEPVSVDLSRSQVDLKSPNKSSDPSLESAILQFAPCIRSGSFAHIGCRRYMEDEHIRIDDLSSHLGSLFSFPKPNAFYGVFDGHGGPEAAAYVRKNVIRLLFEDVDFPQTSLVDDIFQEEVENSLRKAFLLADLALADDCNVSSSSGTTALAALIFGRLLMVANAGDCRAVLCRKGEAVDMSQDHRPIYPSERKRVEELGGYIDDGYLNGVLSVTRALGDWDMKVPQGSASTSPLIAEPEFEQVFLTEEDEFLIIGCDGIWDVMSSQHAVSLVRRGLRRHDDPEQCARDLAMEALRLNTFDNLTVIVVCFSSVDAGEPSPPRRRCCSLSPGALNSLRSLLDSSSSR
ncbi:probable protein phosphatase 2C 49 [Malania oleifera]|uniref:probable protein phosphatase 2C 49 n=1 Tax=Malania oleifera TaxID=397392 RepID=UPI0025AE5F2B|nr:probable protein phosphatase 2C 49 [Malania oleifera]